MSEDQPTSNITAEQLARFTQYVRFESRDREQNLERFYLLNWHATLHGETALVCTWGRCGTSGRSRAIFFAAGAHVETRLERLMRRRLQREYHVTAWH